ncbi:uncharacterized protein LOC115699094 [Cannabis sativa]|uniref:uncharacterized protein LOC115699094 n=1 Tax=Cannabis sativa TaxID=3483 RepID=UPI0029C9B485|nr:uncharacterized protein LOC115699094 [Cannabis sativa]
MKYLFFLEDGWTHMMNTKIRCHGKGKHQVKIVQSTDLFEDIIRKRVVEILWFFPGVSMILVLICPSPTMKERCRLCFVTVYSIKVNILGMDSIKEIKMGLDSKNVKFVVSQYF